MGTDADIASFLIIVIEIVVGEALFKTWRPSNLQTDRTFPQVYLY
jgi:hypothetical protein